MKKDWEKEEWASKCYQELLATPIQTGFILYDFVVAQKEKQKQELIEEIEKLNEEMFNGVEFYNVSKYEGVLKLLEELKSKLK